MNIQHLLTNVTMTTLEVARLTGKEHRNVLADCRTMFDRLGGGSAQIWMQAEIPAITAAQISAAVRKPIPNGGYQDLEYFILNQQLLFTLIGGYSVPLRSYIVHDWIHREEAALAHFNQAQIEQVLSVAYGGPVDLERSRYHPTNYSLNLLQILQSITPYARPMTSSEITHITGKQHKHVVRDIDNMFRALNIDPTPYVVQEQYLVNQGAARTRRTYNLPKEYALILITGYDPRELYAIVTRWLELSESLVSHIETAVLKDGFCIGMSL